MYAPLRVMRAHQKDRLFLSWVLSSILSAKQKDKPANIVAESFMAVNAGRLVLAMSAMNGLLSTAPK